MAASQAPSNPLDDDSGFFGVDNPYKELYSNLDQRNLAKEGKGIVERFKAKPDSDGYFEFAGQIAVLLLADILDELERHWPDPHPLSNRREEAQYEWNMFKAKRWRENIDYLEKERKKRAEEMEEADVWHDSFERTMSKVRDIFKISLDTQSRDPPQAPPSHPNINENDDTRLNEEDARFEKITSPYWGGVYVPIFMTRESFHGPADLLLDMLRFFFSETHARTCVCPMKADGTGGIWDKKLFEEFKEVVDAVVSRYMAAVEHNDEFKKRDHYQRFKSQYDQITKFLNNGIKKFIDLHREVEVIKRDGGDQTLPTNRSA
ncbi:hypothetical protein BJ508DRAFT_54061 [Ascobolus immersus RN42]|uniref:Uncharacterized protein n=1 Tax=Ascobolus immersus RN42 TaxID=1160509 RepID=A0A3N4HGJ6_ASCIM|nr:hypothetical protein BJ508DRAFT_54061 [Ascobolus immersus RN42]